MAASTWAAASGSSSSKMRTRSSRSTSSSNSARSTGWIEARAARSVSRSKAFHSSPERFSSLVISGLGAKTQQGRDQEVHAGAEQVVEHRHERAASDRRVLLEPLEHHG